MKRLKYSLLLVLFTLTLSVIPFSGADTFASATHTDAPTVLPPSDVIANEHFSSMVGALAPRISGAQKIIVIRAVASDDVGITTRYTQAQAQSLFDNQLNTLWKNTSYGNITIKATVTSLVTLPSNRAAYLGTGGSSLGNLNLALTDAIAAASGLGLDYTGVKAVMVLIGLPSAPAFFFRGVENTIMLPIGSGGSSVASPAALFAENWGEPDTPGGGVRMVWGRWAHEIGHAFQSGGPAHPSNYNNEFELMDRLYPGQSGMFEKYIPTGFPGWMPAGKYKIIAGMPNVDGFCGDTAFIKAEELDPAGVAEYQAAIVQMSSGLYYVVSVRKKLNGDELFPIPDEGVLIERVVVGADPWVTVQGKGGDRTKLWQPGDTYTSPENDFFLVSATSIPDVYQVTVRCQNKGQPDVFLTPWLTPPNETYETSDIWIDSSCNGYGTFQYGTYTPLGDSTPVGNGNGDNPCSNHANRVYARIRNIGTQPAINVVVHFDVTDPLGVGVAGATGWTLMGDATSATFPALASIPAGGYTDVYVNWTPVIASPPTGNFDFHSCIRVRSDPVAGELTTANNTAQENIAQFSSPSAASGAGAPITQIIHLFNDSTIITKTFNLYWTTDLPPSWGLDINSNQTQITLAPSAIRDLPVKIIPNGPRVAGSIYNVHVAVNSGRLLENTLDPTDTHFDAPLLGGVNFQIRIANPSRITTKPSRTKNGFLVTGNFTKNPGTSARTPLTSDPITVDLLDAPGHVLTSQLVYTDSNGDFSASFGSNSSAVSVAASYSGDPSAAGSIDSRLIDPANFFLPLILR